MSRGAITHIIQYYVLFCAKIQGMFRVTERRLGDILWKFALYRPVTVHVYIFPVQIQVSQCRHWCSVVASSLCLTLWKWRTTVSCWCDPLNDVLLIAWSVCECKVAFMTWQCYSLQPEEGSPALYLHSCNVSTGAVCQCSRSCFISVSYVLFTTTRRRESSIIFA